MKTKKFNKKLSLNKKTVANLNGKEMNAVNAGEISPPINPLPTLDDPTCIIAGCTDTCCTQGTSAGAFCC